MDKQDCSVPIYYNYLLTMKQIRETIASTDDQKSTCARVLTELLFQLHCIIRYTQREKHI